MSALVHLGNCIIPCHTRESETFLACRIAQPRQAWILRGARAVPAAVDWMHLYYMASVRMCSPDRPRNPDRNSSRAADRPADVHLPAAAAAAVKGQALWVRSGARSKFATTPTSDNIERAVADPDGEILQADVPNAKRPCATAGQCWVLPTLNDPLRRLNTIHVSHLTTC